MKKLFAAIFIGALTFSAQLSVLAQKNRYVSQRRTAVKTSPLAKSNIKLNYAAGFSDGNGVYLEWQPGTETENLGFFVYRYGAKGYELASQAMIAGGSLRSSETVVSGSRYSFFDPQGDLNSAYMIESFSAAGHRQSVAQVAPQYLADLTKVAGQTADQLRATALSASPSIEQGEADLPLELRAQTEAEILPPNPDQQRWIANQPGVKIGVKQDGFYRVSRAELQSAGFDVNVPGSLWQLYTDGNEQAVIVGANDAYLEFYGRGMDTQESNTRVYYLIAGAQNGRRISPLTLETRRGTATATNYRNVFTKKERAIYVSSNVLNGERENFFGATPVTPTSNPTITFNLSGVDFASGKSSIEVSLQSLTIGNHQVRVILNGQQLESINGFGITLMTGFYKIPTGFFLEGANTIQFQAMNGASDISLVESIKVNFPRKYQASQNRLSFYTENSYKTSVSGFTSANVRVFDLSAPDNPALIDNLSITGNNGNFGFNLPANTRRVMYALEDSGVLSVSSITPNTPSTLSTAANSGEMIIVSHKDWLAQSEDWANYRRSQGMTVKVVEVTDIFDEFSYGAVSSAGMTAFFNYAKNNWQNPPNYILLMGDGTYDFKNYENRPFTSFVPTKLVDTIYEETGSDEALCDFNNDGLAEIAVGRIPARSGAVVTQLLNKVMTFEATISTAQSRGALMVSDLPNGYDFEGVNQRLAAQLPANMPKTFINRSQVDARNLLLTTINSGKYLVNYSGHGSTGAWDGNFITLNDGPLLTNAPNYTMFFMLTCLNGYFVRNDFDSLAESLLKAQNGGAVSAWASSGKTTPDIQEAMATRFYNRLTVSNMTRIGDLIKDAKAAINGGRDVRLSWALLGDPAMKLKENLEYK